MKKKLEVGDVLYTDTKFYGMNRIEIDRVTPTQAHAQSGKIKLRREFGDGAKEIGDTSQWSGTRYYLATEQLDAKYERQCAGVQLEKAMKDIANISLEKVRAILKILNDPQP